MSVTKGYKCYNISCGSCVGRTLCGELGDKALNCIDRIVRTKTMGDYIRSMTDKQMSKELINMISELCEDGIPSEEFALDWFRKPYFED